MRAWSKRRAIYFGGFWIFDPKLLDVTVSNEMHLSSSVNAAGKLITEANLKSERWMLLKQFEYVIQSTKWMGAGEGVLALAPKRFEFAYPLASGVGGFGGSVGGSYGCLNVLWCALLRFQLHFFAVPTEGISWNSPSGARTIASPSHIESWQAHFHGNCSCLFCCKEYMYWAVFVCVLYSF